MFQDLLLPTGPQTSWRLAFRGMEKAKLAVGLLASNLERGQKMREMQRA